MSPSRAFRKTPQAAVFVHRQHKSWVKFYFRLREARSGKDALRRDFDSFEDGNSKGEWTVRLRTEDDVRLLLTHLRGP